MHCGGGGGGGVQVGGKICLEILSSSQQSARDKALDIDNSDHRARCNGLHNGARHAYAAITQTALNRLCISLQQFKQAIDNEHKNREKELEAAPNRLASGNSHISSQVLSNAGDQLSLLRQLSFNLASTCGHYR